MATKIGVPKFVFTTQAAAAEVSSRLKSGIVALILRDSGASAGVYSIGEAADIPDGLSANSVAYIKNAMLGSRDSAPSKVVVSVIDTEGDLVTDGAAALVATEFDYLAGPPDMTAEEAASLKAWLTEARKGYCIGKMVAADYAADDMAVINFSASGILADGVEYDGAAYCSRIAGILASTDLSASATYAPLTEVTGVDAIADPDDAVDSGKLILLHDGRKAKIARAVNSLVTVPESQSGALKKIKVVEAVDLIRSNAIRLVEDNYTGRKANSYDNKLAIVADLQDFMTQLEVEDILLPGSGQAEINYAAQRAWLKERGVKVEDMSNQDILEADTGSYVFIALSGTILDAMEDFLTNLTMGGNV